MSNFKQHKQKTGNFTVVPNGYLRNNKLSLKARGLLTTLLSLPPTWVFSETGLTKILPDGMGSVRNGLKELETLGYIQRERIRNERGQLKGTVWHIYEEPYFPDDKNPSYEPEVSSDWYYNWMEILDDKEE